MALSFKHVGVDRERRTGSIPFRSEVLQLRNKVVFCIASNLLDLDIRQKSQIWRCLDETCTILV